jgi:hypothetical protein
MPATCGTGPGGGRPPGSNEERDRNGISAPAAIEELRRRGLAIAVLALGWDAIEATLAGLGED